jgi:hypothetical protein
MLHKSILLIITILFWNNIFYSFTETNTSCLVYFNRPTIIKIDKSNQHEKDWKLETEIDGVRIETKTVDCMNTNLGFDRELILLKFTNLTDKELQISYDLELFTNSTCITCDRMPEYHYQINLSANETIEGNCYNVNLNHLKIFSHFLDSRFRNEADEITSFHFENIIVSEIKNIKK